MGVVNKQAKKILFVVPPFSHIADDASKQHTFQKPVFTIPYGLLSLAAYVKAYSKYDVQAEVLDLNLEAFKLCNSMINVEEGLKDVLQKKVISFEPDIVGISALFNTCYNYLGMISTSVKGAAPDCLLIIGGGLGTNLYTEILRNFEFIDACCYGEGEISLRQLVDAEDAWQCLKQAPSWVTRESLKEGRKPVHTFVQDLDEIPFFDYGLINLRDYTGRSLDKSYAQQSLREVSLHTSRGCPFNCVFCSNSTVHGKKIRYMSVGKVISEIERMVTLYGMEVLLIEDDHFLDDKERVRKILKKVHDFKLKVEFPNGVAVYAIDEEIGSLLKNVGVTTLSLAIESGSDFMLKNIINKPLRVSMIKPAVNILRKNGIDIHAFIVLGLPGEQEIHRDETMRMLLDVGFDWVKIFLAIPVAGSRLYDICKEKGYLINGDFGQHVTTRANIRTPDIDPEYLEDKIYLMNLEANFINNYNLKAGNFHKASLHFGNIAKRYPDHAFAHLCLAKAYQGLGNSEDLAAHHANRFRELIETSSVWKRYANIFNLTMER